MISGLLPHISKLKFLVTDNSTVILTAVGVVGTVGTAILTGRATFKAAEIIAEETKMLNVEAFETQEVGTELIKKELTTMTKVKLVWTQYIPPVAAGIITVTSIITANKISSTKIAALTVASGISERALQEYKTKVVEKIGERQDKAIRDEIAQERVTNTPIGRDIVIVGTGEVLCFDIITGRYFQSTVEKIRSAENKVNYNILHYDYASLSFFYEEIGLEPTPFTDSVGWNINNLMELDLTTTMSPDQRPCIAVGFRRDPRTDFDMRQHKAD